MTADLIEWLTAVLDEDQRVARETMATSKWLVLSDDGLYATTVMESPFSHPEIAGRSRIEFSRHIARHDPQSVLARVEAERALVAMHCKQHICVSDWSTNHSYTYTEEGRGFERKLPCPTLRALAYGYRTRPGWQGSWRPDGVEATTDA